LWFEARQKNLLSNNIDVFSDEGPLVHTTKNLWFNGKKFVLNFALTIIQNIYQKNHFFGSLLTYTLYNADIKRPS
jgi:hypothetical protein